MDPWDAGPELIMRMSQLLILTTSGFHKKLPATYIGFIMIKKVRGKGMKNKLIADQLISKEQLDKFIESHCMLLTSKDLARVLNVTEAALRKQRSSNRSLFPFSRIGRRIYYPADLIVKTIHNNLQDAQLR